MPISRPTLNYDIKISLCPVPQQVPSTMPVSEEIGPIMVPVALKNINMNTKEKNPITPP